MGRVLVATGIRDVSELGCIQNASEKGNISSYSGASTAIQNGELLALMWPFYTDTAIHISAWRFYRTWSET